MGYIVTKIYITKSCPEVIPLISELQRLGIEFSTLDIDEDADAGQRLYDLTNDLTVPALELEDGTIFVRPSMEKVHELFPQQAQEMAEKSEAQEPFEQVKKISWVKPIFILLSLFGFALFIFSAAKVAALDVPQSWIWWGLGINILFGIIIGVLQRKNIKEFWMGALFMLHWALLGANLGIGISVYDIPFQPWFLFQRVLLAVGAGYLIVWITSFWWRRQGFNFQRWQVWVGGITTLGFIAMLVFSLLRPESGKSLMTFMIIPVMLLLVVGFFKIIEQRGGSATKLAATLVYPMVALASLLAYL